MSNQTQSLKRPERYRFVEGSSKPVRFTHQFDSVVRLPAEDSGLQHSIVRLNNSHIRTVGRRTPLIILNGKRWVIRYSMGNGGTVKNLTKNAIALDYDAICDLGVRFGQPVNLKVRKASVFESMSWLLNSPDLNIRLNTRFALLGVVLGLVSLIISFLN
jgi:hypothetical protein